MSLHTFEIQPASKEIISENYATPKWNYWEQENTPYDDVTFIEEVCMKT